AIAGFFKAVRRIAVGGIDSHSVAPVLESKSHVDDKPLCTSNAEIGVDDGHIGAIKTRHCGLGINRIETELEWGRGPSSTQKASCFGLELKTKRHLMTNQEHKQ